MKILIILLMFFSFINYSNAQVYYTQEVLDQMEEIKKEETEQKIIVTVYIFFTIFITYIIRFVKKSRLKKQTSFVECV